jgi:hypothetical protein
MQLAKGKASGQEKGYPDCMPNSMKFTAVIPFHWDHCMRIRLGALHVRV